MFRLHLVEAVGRISLAEVTLIEDPSDEERIDEGEWQIDGVEGSPECCKRLIGENIQSRRRPLLGPSPG